MDPPIASICMSTHNKPALLRLTLQSIYSQQPPFEFETIVIDDGSRDEQVRQICGDFPVRYQRIDRPPIFRNPCTARNMAYRMARGHVIIAQSDEVLHIRTDTIERLVGELTPGHFVIANVFCLTAAGKICGEFTGPDRQAPLFFLGSIYREDLYAVGGNDEDFRAAPACEDRWFGECLLYGRKLVPVYTTTIRGHHQYHEYVSRPELEGPSRATFARKHLAATTGRGPWCSSGGPWPFEGKSMADMEQVFTDIYRGNKFGGAESRSGPGSSCAATRAIRRALPKIVKRYDVKTFLDLACGDCNWMHHVTLGVQQYIGVDVVEEMVARNIEQYSDPDHIFLHLDLLSAELPKADLVLCRDCLVHLSSEDVAKALASIRRSGSTYLLATTFTNRKNNQGITTGQWTPYNMQAAPFSWPEPLLIVNENCRECYPQFTDKSLALWKLEDLP